MAFILTPEQVKAGELREGVEDPMDFSFSTKLAPNFTGQLLTGDTVELDKILGSADPPVEHQFSLSSCAANAGAMFIEMMNAFAGEVHIDVARLKIYFDGRSVQAIDDGQDYITDTGMTIRSVFKAMAMFGIAPESMWPYDVTQVNVREPLKSIWYGLKHKLVGYFQLTGVTTDTGPQSLLQEIVTSIRMKHPVEFGSKLPESFLDDQDAGVVNFPDWAKDHFAGNHAMLIIGFKILDDGTILLKLRNSWGVGWRQDGHVWIHQDWVTRGNTFDHWTGSQGVNLNPEAFQQAA